MRFTIDGGELARAAQAAAKVAARSETRSLACALVVAGEGEVTVSATDSDRMTSVRYPALVDEPGRALVPAKALSGVAKSLRAGVVTVACSEGACRVSSGKSRSDIPALDPADWQGPASVGDGPRAVVDAGALSAACGAVAPFAARGDAIAVFDGVHLSFGGGSLAMEATDRYMVARTSLPASGDGRFDAVVPAWFLTEAASLADGEAAVAFDGARLSVESGAASSSTRAIAGKYPDTGRFFDGDRSFEGSADPRSVESAMARAELVDGATSALLEASGGSMAISASGAGGSSMRDEVAAEGEFSFRGSPGRIAACARAVGGGRCRLWQSGADSPLMFDDGTTAAGVMPMVG